jgi:NitT/TauT family transport system substrate-binding protein
MLALLAACAGAPPVAPTAAPTQAATATEAPKPTAAALEKVTVAIGAQAAIVYLPFDVAKALDLYKQEGLDVTLNYMSGGTLAGNALVAGSVDFSGSSLDHPIAAQAQGKELRMVASITRLPGLTVVVRSDMKDKIKTVADLKGQKVGVTSIGSGSHVLTAFLANKAGLKADDVQIVAVGAATAPAAMEKGDVVAIVTSDPYPAQLLKAGKAYALVDFCTEADTFKYLGGEYQFTGMVTTADMIKNRPQTVQKMVNAIVKAERYVATHSPEEIAKLLPDEVTGKDKELYATGLAHSLPALSKDGIVTETGIKNAIEPNKVFGSIKPDQTVNIPALYTTDFAKNVK